MSVYKEIGIFARSVQNKSTQIWNDSCDFGVPIKTLDDRILKEMKGMIELYDMEVFTKRYSTGATQTIIFNAPGAEMEAGFSFAKFEYLTTKSHPSIIGYLQLVNYK